MSDPYTNPDSQAQSTTQAMITRLEERARNKEFLRMIGTYAATLPSTRPLTVLDLGCGTGVVIRQLAAALHPSSVFHGADVSSVLLEEAARLASDITVKWDHVSPGPLPYEDSSFDVIVMHTLLSHVPDPEYILKEANRVLGKEGRLVIFDADHAGTTYGQPTYEATRRLDYLLTSAIATQPDICRQLPRLLKASGFELCDHDSAIISECGRGDYWLSSVRGFSRLLPTLDALSREEADEWVRHMIDSHENGTFFASGAFYTFYSRPREGVL